MRSLNSTVSVVVVALTLGALSTPALAIEDLFRALTVQRPANPAPAPDLALPDPEGRTVSIRDFKGKVVLLGFFTSD